MAATTTTTTTTCAVECRLLSPQERRTTGLRCRFPQGDVPASYDAESGSLTCSVHFPEVAEQDLALLTYQVVKEDGRLLCNIDSGMCRLAGDADDVGKATPANEGSVRLQDDQAGEAEPVSAGSIFRRLSILDRYLYVWILLAMGAGILIGQYVPAVPRALGRVKIVTVSLPISLGLWLMMWPVLTKVRYELLSSLLQRRQTLQQLATSCIANWLLGPALMTGLAWATLPDLEGYREGIIIVGIARCIAMVLIWNQLAGGNAELCALMVAINSVMQIVLFAPLALFYLDVVSRSSASISFWTVARSVLIFLGIPLVAAVATRYGVILAKGQKWLDETFMPWFAPCALLGLLYTIFVMFASQAHQIIHHFGDVCRTVVPLLLYFAAMFSTSIGFSRWRGHRYEEAVTQAFTAASNNFELAIAVAVGAYGIESPQALAATVGPLVEVPVLLGLVYLMLALRKKLGWK